MRIDFQIPESLNGKKVYDVLKTSLKLSSRLITRLKSENGILLNGNSARTIDRVSTGDIVSAVVEMQEESFIEPQDLDLDILFEDSSFLAVNKPPNMPVHPSMGHATGTLANGVLGYFQKQGLSVKVRPINRLDRDTSGLTLFAKNSHIQDQLIRQMKLNRVHKAYLGIVHGFYAPDSGTISLPIARKEGSIMERVIHPSGDESVTHYKALKTNGEISLVEFVLETGRTHQIRVHTKAMGHPLVGDWLYSDIPTTLMERQALHAYKLAFDHPLTGERINLSAPLPPDMEKVLAMI